VGFLPTGIHNAITDVPGVRVGHQTVWKGEPGGTVPVIRSGVTAIWPHPGDLFRERLYAAISVFNGYGEMTGRSVIDEWGLLGSPIVLTDTVHVGLASEEAALNALSQADTTEGRDGHVIYAVPSTRLQTY